MSIIRSIRLVLSRAIAPKTVITHETHEERKAEAQWQAERVQSRVEQYAPQTDGHTDVTRGCFSVNDVCDLVSDYSKSAICNLASWSALAKAFNLFVKNPKHVGLETYLSEFHAWNAVSPNQMGDEQVLEVIARLTQVSPAKANDQTDAIIARVRKVSVAELREERMKKAIADTKRREEQMEQFAQMVWNHVYSEYNFEIPAAKAEMKLIDTMQWIAGWQSGNPAAQASELLLIEADLKHMKNLASRDVGNSDDFVEGVLTSDHMMKQNERAA